MEVREAVLHAETPEQYPIQKNKRIAAYWANIELKKQKTA
jgi:hypothetical protein